MASATGAERGRWLAFGERTIHRDSHVWLCQVDVRRPDGVRLWHDVVRLHRSAGVVLLDDADRVLLQWRHRFISGRWGWELPGGLVDAGEEPAQTVVRELAEETGYHAGRLARVISFQPVAGRVDSEHVLFVGRDPVRVAEPVEVNEASSMEWVPLGSIPQMIAAGEIWNSGTLIGLLHVLAFGPPARTGSCA